MRTPLAFCLTLGLAALLAFAATAGPTPTPRPAPPDFSRDVRPILSQRCFKCHGPDDKARAAGLRLDTPQGAYALLNGGRRAVAPGKPEKSELLRRVLLTGGPLQMPPAHTNKPLSPAQKDTLKRWIAAGAEYKTHWAFVPPVRPNVPKIQNPKSKIQNPIDAFILARLEKEGLAPSPEADRYALARRVSLDLTGLPPTPEESEAFASDKSPNAYEKLVDRLLASPAYGERWARKWLDLARYADTNGYEKDRPRSVWPYRDWVINALNADMPFNQFTVEQIAGDILPNPTQAQRIATGFHRNTMLNEEGGIDPLEFRFHAVTDRLATTGTVWLGLTVGCAQCHTHKYDPITHKEYYRLFAFLNNADEPEMDVVTPEVRAKRGEIEKQAREREARLADKFPPADGLSGPDNLSRKLREWVAANEPRAVEWKVLRPTRAVSNRPLLTVLEDASVFASGDQGKADTYDLTFPDASPGVTALRLEALPDPRLPRSGPGRVFYEGPPGDFFLSEITLFAGGRPQKVAKASASFGSAQPAIDGDKQSGWSVGGGQGRAHAAVFVLEKPTPAGALLLSMLFEKYYAAGLGRFRVSVTTDPKAGPADLPPDVESVLTRPAATRTPAQNDRLRAHFLAVAPELAKEREEIAKLRLSAPAFPTALAFAERPKENPRPTYIYNRGEFLQPKERVSPAVFAFLPGLQSPQPDRLAFARWLVDGRNPLTARVLVNRQWQSLFGTGLVKTTEDFGFQGEAPSHPELLDWLAVEFVKRGWSLKKLHRLLVTSATYRQSSRVTPRLLAKDPQNRLLARGPRTRLEAEMLRDAALLAGGLLSRKVGGPSVFPPQEPGITTQGVYGPLTWTVSQGEDRYRRGLYTFAKRTAPYAAFLTFDAPSGEACTARREVSNTPLQALTLMNDPAFVEAAQALGKSTAALPGTTEARAASLFRRVTARPPARDELAMLAKFHGEQRARFEKKELDANAVAGPGANGTDAAERAAWTALARSLLNLDEFVTKR